MPAFARAGPWRNRLRKTCSGSAGLSCGPGAAITVIVHGHCAHETPQVRHNRIGIDTGAYLTDRLACLVLRGSEQAFLFAEGA